MVKQPKRNIQEMFHIPVLIYAPGIIRPQVREEIASQVDILPTILDILNLEMVHSSMGSSLLRERNDPFSVVRLGNQFAIFKNSYVFLTDLNDNDGMYDYLNDPSFKSDLKALLPVISEGMKDNLLTYLQSVTYSIAKDKIYFNKRE